MDIDSTFERWPAPKRYGVAFAILLVALFARLALLPADSGVGFLTFYPAMMVIFLLCGVGPGFCMAILSTVLAYFLFFPPYRTFAYGPAGPIIAFRRYFAVERFSRVGSSTWFTATPPWNRTASERLASIGAELLRSEQRYRAVVEDQTEIICRYRADGTLVFINDAFCRLVGRPRSELLGHPWTPITLAEGLSYVQHELSRLSPETQTRDHREPHRHRESGDPLVPVRQSRNIRCRRTAQRNPVRGTGHFRTQGT